MRRGSEIVPADFHDVLDVRPHLHVDAESAVEGVAGSGDEAEGKLTLEHKDAGSREGTTLQEFEDERRGDLSLIQDNLGKT